jgi:hypothetical protein
MDKVMSKEAADFLYLIKEIITDHKVTLNQTFYMLCSINNIEYDITADELVGLYNKGLIVKNKVNATKLFHLKEKDAQLSLDMPHTSKPNGTKISLTIADKIEKEFVLDSYLTDEEKKYVADKYFKGDLSAARYYIIFRSLFPVRNKKKNVKWNKKFSFAYDGVPLWDDSLRVAKKFHEIYRKKDIGAFLEGTYMAVKDATNLEEERCFMTKPYKYLAGYDQYYRDALDKMKEREEKKSTNDELGKSIDNLKV